MQHRVPAFQRTKLWAKAPCIDPVLPCFSFRCSPLSFLPYLPSPPLHSRFLVLSLPYLSSTHAAGKVLDEDVSEATYTHIITASLPVVESFGLTPRPPFPPPSFSIPVKIYSASHASGPAQTSWCVMGALHKPTQACTNLHKPTQTCTNLHKPAHTYTYLHTLAQTCTNLVVCDGALHNPAQSCTNLHKPA